MGTYYETASSNIYFPIIMESFWFESFFRYFPIIFPIEHGIMVPCVPWSLYHCIIIFLPWSLHLKWYPWFFFYVHDSMCPWNIMKYHEISWYFHDHLYHIISKMYLKIVSMISIHGDHDLFPPWFRSAQPRRGETGRRMSCWAKRPRISTRPREMIRRIWR